jgi:hypothetical protein
MDDTPLPIFDCAQTDAVRSLELSKKLATLIVHFSSRRFRREVGGV